MKEETTEESMNRDGDVMEVMFKKRQSQPLHHLTLM